MHVFPSLSICHCFPVGKKRLLKGKVWLRARARRPQSEKHRKHRKISDKYNYRVGLKAICCVPQPQPVRRHILLLRGSKLRRQEPETLSPPSPVSFNLLGPNLFGLLQPPPPIAERIPSFSVILGLFFYISRWPNIYYILVLFVTYLLCYRVQREQHHQHY